jgi:hypothetical protein
LVGKIALVVEAEKAQDESLAMRRVEDDEEIDAAREEQSPRD